MNTHHTPGPWSIQADDLDSFTIYSEQMNIAEILAIGGEGMSDEGEANARLIAAAPELLEALQECITSEGAACFGDMQDHPERMQRRLYAIADIARAAIAKATQP